MVFALHVILNALFVHHRVIIAQNADNRVVKNTICLVLSVHKIVRQITPRIKASLYVHVQYIRYKEIVYHLVKMTHLSTLLRTKLHAKIVRMLRKIVAKLKLCI